MKPFQWIIVFVVLLAIFYFSGQFLSDTCIEAGSCRSCWKMISVKAGPELCGGNGTCFIEPSIQQHNAIVELLLCACAETKDNSYSDSGLNSRIESVLNEYYGVTMDARELCENPGVMLVKMGY